MQKLWSKITSFNDSFAVKLTIGMSTIWCVYTFFVWSILPLIFPGMETVCMYVSSTVIQLVALPALALGQNILGRNAEIRAQQDHEALMDAVADLHHIMTEEDNETSALADIKDRLARIEAAFSNPQPSTYQ